MSSYEQGTVISGILFDYLFVLCIQLPDHPLFMVLQSFQR